MTDRQEGSPLVGLRGSDRIAFPAELGELVAIEPDALGPELGHQREIIGAVLLEVFQRLGREHDLERDLAAFGLGPAPVLEPRLARALDVLDLARARAGN